jgi:peptide/nickel transport system substrate-binding protein
MSATSFRRRGRLVVGAVAVAAVALVAGCGGSGSGSSGGNAASGQGGGGAAGSGIPSTVTVGLDRAVTTLDPDQAIQPPELSVLGLVAGTLTSVGPDGKDVQLALAKSQKVSQDQLTWTYGLKPGLKFSDGSPLTAADAAASFQRSVDDKANVHGSFYTPIKSVTASGDSTVVFHLKSPYASLPMVITQPEFAVFPASKLASKDFFKQPISAGPYTVTSYSSDQRVDLAANSNYAGPAPAISKLVFQYIQDPGTRLSELKAHQIQWAGALPGSMLPQISGDGLRQVTIPGFSATYVYINNRKPPLDDVRVRKAISLGIDRDKLNEIAYRGKTKPLLGFLPSTMDYSQATLPGADAAQAKQMLAGSKCAGGCKLTLMVRNGLTDFLDMASVIQQQLKPLGIDVSIERTDPGIASKHELDGDFQLEVNNLLSRANFPDGFLNLGLFSDTQIKALYSGYDSPKMDAAIQRAIANGGDRRQQAMDEVNKQFAADLPYIPLVNGVEFAGTSLPDGALTVGANGLYYVGSK